MSQKIALFAGSGLLPKLLIDHFINHSIEFVIVGFYGQTSIDLIKNHPHIQVHLGTVKPVLEFLKKNNINDVVMAGAIKKPSLTDLKLDSTGVKWLAKCGPAFFGDDSLLKTLIKLLRAENLNVRSPQDFLKDSLLTPHGLLTRLAPKPHHQDDIDRGIDVLNALSNQDVGQAVIVQQKIVLGIEAIEGTKKLIERCAPLKLSYAKTTSKGVLIKMAKTNQTLQADLPTVGPDTLSQLSNSGFDGLALQAFKTQIIDRDQFIKKANELKLFVVGF